MTRDACPYCRADLGDEEPHLEFLRHLDASPVCRRDWEEWRDAMADAEIRTE